MDPPDGQPLLDMLRPALLVAAAVYAIALHALLAYLLLKPRQAPNPVETTRRFHAWADPHVPDGAVLFFGDSITQGLATSAVSERAVNFGIGRQTSAQLLAALPGYRSIERAGAVYLQIGANDFLNRTPEGLEGRLASIDSAFDGIPRVWTGIHAIRGVDAARIARANAAIEARCTADPRCRYVQPLPDDARYYRDHVHLSDAGYERWIAALKSVDLPGR